MFPFMILSLRYSTQNSNQSKVFKINSVKCLTWGQIMYIRKHCNPKLILFPHGNLRTISFMGSEHLSRDNCNARKVELRKIHSPAQN